METFHLQKMTTVNMNDKAKGNLINWENRSAPFHLKHVIGPSQTDIVCHIEICVSCGWCHPTMGELVSKTGIKAVNC